MANISNLKMGAASITVGGVSIGHTLGGAIVTITRVLKELNADQYGSSKVDLVVTGVELDVEVTLAEDTTDNLYAVMPEAKDVIGSLSEKLGIGVDAGASLRASAKQLILHPVDRASTDLSADVVIFKAVCSSNVPLNYEVDKQRVSKVKFSGLIDESRGNGYRLGQIGQDPIS